MKMFKKLENHQVTAIRIKDKRKQEQEHKVHMRRDL